MLFSLLGRSWVFSLSHYQALEKMIIRNLDRLLKTSKVASLHLLCIGTASLFGHQKVL